MLLFMPRWGLCWLRYDGESERSCESERSERQSRAQRGFVSLQGGAVGTVVEPHSTGHRAGHRAGHSAGHRTGHRARDSAGAGATQSKCGLRSAALLALARLVGLAVGTGIGTLALAGTGIVLFALHLDVPELEGSRQSGQFLRRLVSAATVLVKLVAILVLILLLRRRER